MNDIMQCSHAQNLFSAYFDADLDPAATKLLEKHLASCALCKKEWSYFEKTMHLVHEELRVTAPPDILSGVHRKLSRTNPLKAFWYWLREFDFSLSVPAAAATVAIVFVAAVTVKFVYLGQKNPLVAFTNRSTVASTAETGDRQTPPRTIPQTKFTTSTSRQFPSIMQHPERLSHPQMLVPFEFMDNEGRLSQNIPGVLPPYGLLPGAPHDFGLIPDIIVTVRASTPNMQTSLYKNLVRSKDWKVQRHDDKLIFVFVRPEDLIKLQQTMEAEGISLTLPSKEFLALHNQRNLLAVAVHLN